MEYCGYDDYQGYHMENITDVTSEIEYFNFNIIYICQI